MSVARAPQNGDILQRRFVRREPADVLSMSRYNLKSPMQIESIAPPRLAAAATHTKPAGWASFAALGIVFGDLGTSPLYTLQTVVQATGGQFTPQSALGILSAIIWTLIITVSIKYCVFVMRADNHGEGGILALMSLIGANGFK